MRTEIVDAPMGFDDLLGDLPVDMEPVKSAGKHVPDQTGRDQNAELNQTYSASPYTVSHGTPLPSASMFWGSPHSR